MEYPLLVYLYNLAELLPLKFYNYKIVKIFDEKSPFILSFFPQMNIMRLHLLFVMRKILKKVSIPSWENHCRLLEANINYEAILKDEFQNKHLPICSGVSGYCLLLSGLDHLTGSRLLTEQKDSIVEKIVASELWDSDFSNLTTSGLGLLNGFSGINLVYQLFLSN
jgi:hypothetical protein